MAIVENQMATIKWSNRNKTRFSNLGYDNFSNGKEFFVKIEDLSPGSNAMVKYTCDFCKNVFARKYSALANKDVHYCSVECHNGSMVGKSPWNKKRFITNCCNCNKQIERSEWEKERSNNLFCSIECSNEFKKGKSNDYLKVSRIDLKCSYCHTDIQRTEKEFNRATNHFCSHQCSSLFNKNKINFALRNGQTVNCRNCNTDFYLAQNRIEKQSNYFCSNNCRLTWMKSSDYEWHTRPSTLVSLTCKVCESEIKRKPSLVKMSKTKSFYCSRECAHKDRANWNLPQYTKGKRISVQCHDCGKVKEVLPSVHKKNKYFFCSFECYQGKRLEITDAKITGTSIHRKVNSILDELAIPHENEKRFYIYSADISLLNTNLLIEVNGDYWHGNPVVYETHSLLNNTQLSRIATDKRKRTLLNAKYDVKTLYLWESDINKRPELCKELILLFMSNGGNLKDYNSFNYTLIDGNLLLTNNKLIRPYQEQ